MYCPKCKHPNPMVNRFCGQCGAELDARSVANQPLEKAAHNARIFAGTPWQTSPTQPASGSLERNHPQGPGSVPDSPPPKPREAGADDDARTARSADNQRSLHGPSFLGLNDDPAENPGLDYLYEYDEPRSGGFLRVMVALLLVVGFGLFILYELRQNPDLKGAIVAQASALNARVFGPPASTPATTRPAAQVATKPDTAPVMSADESPGTTVTVTPSDASDKAAAEKKPPTLADDKDKSNQSARAAKDATRTERGSDKKDTTGGAEATAPGKPSALPGGASLRENEATAAPQRDAGDQLFTRGVNYLYGRGGLPRSCDQALVYLQSAANMGNAKARSQLGGLYATGHCVPLDRAKAYDWFSLAASADHRNIWVERNREMLWSQMSEDERQRATNNR